MVERNAAKATEEKLAKGTTVHFGAPANTPAGLVESLIRTLQRNPEIIEAYLAQVHYVKEGEKPHLALVLRIDPTPALTLEAIRKDLATAGRPFLDQNGFIDIFVDEGRSPLVSEVTKAVRPFYVRKTTR